MLQHILKRAKDVVEIFFQTRPAHGRRVDSSAGFDPGGALLQIIVQLIAGLSLGAAGAPHFAIDVSQPRLVRRNRALAAANASGAVDGRQLVVFLKKNHHAIRQLDALRLRRMELWQLRNRYLLPGLLRSLMRLRPQLHAAAEEANKDEQDESKDDQWLRIRVSL